MRKDVMMISAELMMMAMASCDQTEYREITEDRVVSQPVDTIKVADHFYLDGYLSRTSENIGGRQLNAVNLFSDGEELYVANFAGKCIDVFDAETLGLKRIRFQTSPGRVSERQTLPLLGLGQVYSRSTQRACGTVMRSCASRPRWVA